MWPKRVIKKDFLKESHLNLLKNIKWTTSDEGWDILTPQIVGGKFHDLKFRSLPEGSGTMPTNIPTSQDFLDMYKTYEPRMFSMLKALAPEKVPYYRWTEIQVVCTGKDFNFRIHNDSLTKLLSTVTYISPHKNVGTILYDNEQGDNPREVEWEPNKTFVFSRTEDSWHSYKSDGVSPRVTLVYTLRGQYP